MFKKLLLKSVALSLLSGIFLIMVILPKSSDQFLMKQEMSFPDQEVNITSTPIKPASSPTASGSPIIISTDSSIATSISLEINTSPKAQSSYIPLELTNNSHTISYQPYYCELKALGILNYWDTTLESRYYDYKYNNQGYSWEEAVTYVNIGLDMPFYRNVQAISQCDSTTVLVNKYHSLPKKYEPSNIRKIRASNSSRPITLRYDACIAYEAMCDAASEDGAELIAVSAFRSYEYQREVYDRNKTRDISLEEYQRVRDRTIARPGHSEHQTGLAIDIGTSDDYSLQETFEDTLAGIWLAENSYNYGYILRYPKGKEHITGYKYEPWHFRYVGTEVALEVFESGLTYDEFCARGMLKQDQ